MIDDIRVFSKNLAFGLIGVGVFLSVMIFVQLSNGSMPVHYSPIAVYFAYASTLIVIPILMILAMKKPRFKLPAIVWFHFTMAVMMIFFSEIYSPFTPLWSMLVLIASIYYGWKGFVGSSASLYAMSLTYVALFSAELKPNVVVYTVLALLVSSMTVFISYLFVRIIMSTHVKNGQLEAAQHSERLQVNRLSTLLNSISDAVMTLNRYGRVTSQNAAAQAFFDTNQSLIGRNIDQILQLTDSNDKPVNATELARTIKTSSLRDDLSTGKGAEKRHLSIQMSRIRGTYSDEEEYGVVLILRDITKQKSLEEEKDEFISVTSHELRTPVAIAEGSLSNLMLMHERMASETKIHDAAEVAHAQIVYLSKMINDLSTLSRAERGVGGFIEPVNVNMLLHDLYGRYEPEATKKKLQLDLDVQESLPSVETSRLYLEEILQNFITNAIKYTKDGSVTIGAKMEPEGRIRFFVKDTGIGMSKTDLEHIFEKFYRSEDYRTRETNGTGLGLYVVRKLADKMDTKVNVDSHLNNGSTFSFVLPVSTVNVPQQIEEVSIEESITQDVDVVSKTNRPEPLSDAAAESNDTSDSGMGGTESVADADTAEPAPRDELPQIIKRDRTELAPRPDAETSTDENTDEDIVDPMMVDNDKRPVPNTVFMRKFEPIPVADTKIQIRDDDQAVFAVESEVIPELEETPDGVPEVAPILGSESTVDTVDSTSVTESEPKPSTIAVPVVEPVADEQEESVLTIEPVSPDIQPDTMSHIDSEPKVTPDVEPNGPPEVELHTDDEGEPSLKKNEMPENTSEEKSENKPTESGDDSPTVVKHHKAKHKHSQKHHKRRSKRKHSSTNTN